MNAEQLEKCSSAITLSDMEVFVFPDLALSLVLANIMSPVIWKWRELDCFKKLEGKSSYKKLMRLKQFIMDEYEFNLDLETWGLTTRPTELKRFEPFISSEDIARSNALFGYTGDKYYFDVDIRRHFGLDKYGGDVIPYWKTETVEAMNAFRLKPGYSTGAGECVSLSTLYAAAAFIVCGIPLENIYMILTPLHSQNFIDIEDGVLTNNRRLVTKTMWFNGTEISNMAQRALRNERVTVIAHTTGYVHCYYDTATIDPQAHKYFAERLNSYLTSELNIQSFANFLRCNPQYQRFFQFCRDCHGRPQFLRAEILFHYEHDSDFRIAEKTHEKLLSEVSEDDFVSYYFPDRIRCDEFSQFVINQKPDVRTDQGKLALTKYLAYIIPGAAQLVDELADFLHTEAKLPGVSKQYVQAEPIKISTGQTREQIIEYLRQMRAKNSTAELAFYSYRDMQSCQWEPFIKAAIERSPVSIELAKAMSVDQLYDWLSEMKNDSIYDNKRVAQPDELANYKTGDGLEKAFLLANVIHCRTPDAAIEIDANGEKVILKADREYQFASSKGFQEHLHISE